MDESYELTIADIAAQISGRRLTPVKLMEALLSRVTAMESRLRVWVTLDPEAALESARLSEKELELKGPRGPLHGVPVGVKDIFYTKGVKTTSCSPIYDDFVPEYDSTVVTLLKEAGAIIMGKTVTTQFALSDPPPTLNPWNSIHTPGGSSSGSAVGVAARMFPASIGTQTGGSILRPSSYNGVVGLKPSFGRVSKYGVVPAAWSLDTMGPITRTVEDAALMLQVLAGYDPMDCSSSTRHVPDYHKAALSHPEPPRIGLLRQFFYDMSDSEVREHTDSVVQRFALAGADIQEIKVPVDLEILLEAHRVIMTVEAAAVHQEDFNARPDDYSPNVRKTVETGMLTPAVTYIQAQRIRRKFRRDLNETIDRFDVLLTPSTATPAPADLSTTGDPMFQSPWTACGFPAITIPTGLSTSRLPLGVQLVAAPFAEETLLSVAHWCEEILDVTLTPPDIV